VPPLIRRYIKTSFVFLIAGLLLGGWILLGEFVRGVYPPRLFVTAHVHLLLVGFMLMLVMGVATWMFPRPARDDRRYRPELAEAVYWVMTSATALRAAAELGAGLSGAPLLRGLVAVGGFGQLAGAILFAANMWSRVRMPAVPPAPPRASP
jgi:cbb3-type cytochrome oxidase subunit 1